MSSASITDKEDMLSRLPWLAMRQALAWACHRDRNLSKEANFGDHRAKLLDYLRQGYITAHVQQPDGTYRAIPPVEWMSRELTPQVDLNPAYLQRDELLKFFPDGNKIKQTITAERECGQWLREQFAADPEERRSKGSFWEQARATFGGRLSKRAFDRMWGNVAPDYDRNRPGAKKKS